MNLSTFELIKNMETHSGGIELSGEQLRRLQAVLLDMLDDIDAFCRENNVHYMLSGGSVLGAVRHRGFIPWDDDIDLFMTRAEYDRFRALFPGSMEDKYSLCTPETTEKHGHLLAKIRKKGTVVREFVDSADAETGVSIDIFVLENTYDRAIFRKLHGFLCMAGGFCFSVRSFFRNRRVYMALAENVPEAKRVFRVKIALGFLTGFMTLDGWTRFVSRIYAMCRRSDSRYVVCPAGRKHFTGEMYERHPFCDVAEGEFEGRRFPIPGDADGYLKLLYGDYMQIPPVEKREKHILLEFDLDGDRASGGGQ